MLDEFRSTNITWDKATSRIYSPITANESDENGRKLVVQVVNGGPVEDLTGSALHLYWETIDKLHEGLDVFKAVDLKKGMFELSYTTGMLSNKGVLRANLVLVNSVGRIVSDRFRITVKDGIDNDAIQSENSFSSLTQALIDISNLEQKYAPRLNDLTAQLQQTEAEIAQLENVKADQAFVDSQFAAIVSGAPKGTFTDLTSLQSAYPSGAEGVFLVLSNGHWYYWNAVTSSWTDGGLYQATGIADNSVTFEKRTVLGEQGYIYGNKPVFVDLVEGKIYFSPAGTTHRVYYRKFNYAIPSGTIIDIPELTSPFLHGLWFNTVLKSFHVIGHSLSSTITDDLVLLGYYSSTPNYQKFANFNGYFKYKGDITRTYESAMIIGPSPIVVDFNAMNIVFPPKTSILSKGEAVNYVAGFTREIPPEENTKFLFNKSDGNIYSQKYNESHADKDVLIGVVRSVGNEKTAYFNGNFRVVDGQESIGNIADKEDYLAYNGNDVIWSWWAHPLAIRHQGLRDKSYIGYTDSQGYSGVMSIDNVSGQIVKKRLKKADIDDHNAPAIEVMSDGRIIAAYSGGHNTDQRIHIRISSKPESVEEFDEETLIEIGKNTTYNQLFYKNGKWFLFFRINNNGWAYISSVDGKVWSEWKQFLTAGMQYYMKIAEVSDSNMLRMIMYSNPTNGTDTNLRLGFFDPVTETMKLEDGTDLGAGIISKDAFPIIVPLETDKRQRLLDVAITPIDETVIVYGVFTGAEDGIYKVATKTVAGTLDVKQLTATGVAFLTSSVYLNGAVFKDKNTVILSRGASGVDYIEKWSFSGVAWTKTNDIHASKVNEVAIRPIIEKGGDRLFWQEGYYNPKDYKDFQTDLKFEDSV